MAVEVSSILKKIVRQQNGEIAEGLSKGHGTYSKQYGVPTHTLKDVAKTYIGNNDLAKELWNRQWRETMIMACMVADQMMAEETVLEWGNNLTSLEIAEQLAFQLVWKLQEAQKIVFVWLNTPNVFTQCAAILTALHLIRRNKYDTTFIGKLKKVVTLLAPTKELHPLISRLNFEFENQENPFQE